MLDQTLLNTNRKNCYDGIFSLIIVNLLVFIADHVLGIDLIKNFYLDLSPQSVAPWGYAEELPVVAAPDAPIGCKNSRQIYAGQGF